MPETNLTEQEATERARQLASATNALEFSMRDFLREAYLLAIPADKFVGFWHAIAATPQKGETLASRKALCRYMNGAYADKEEIDLKYVDNEDFFKKIDAVCPQKPELPDETLRRNVLGCLDITGFFKFQFLDRDFSGLMGGTVLQMVKARYPKIAGMKDKTWEKTNRQAREGRNGNIGHPNAHTFRDMTPAEWRTAMSAWLKIADLMRVPQTEALYQRVKSDSNAVDQITNRDLIQLKEFTKDCPNLTLEQIAEILAQYNYQVLDGAVFCNKEEALNCLHKEEHNRDIEKVLADIRAEQEQARREIPMASEAVIINAALEKRLQKVPPLTLLPACKGAPLEGRTLVELAETHYIVLTSSLLMSREGRSFVSNRLIPALKLAKRDPNEALIVDGTTQYHLYRKRMAYNKLADRYRMTLWTPQQDAERRELLQRCQELRPADKAYHYIHEEHLPILGAPDPLSTEEESLLSLMESHPFDRFCVLLCGAAGFVRMIDRKQLPFVQVGRVRTGAEHPVCTLFPQLMPMARAAADEPLLADLLAAYQDALAEEPTDEDDDEPNREEPQQAAEVRADTPPAPPPEPAPAPVAVPPEPKPEPKPEPAPRPAPEPKPAPQPVQAAPQPKPEQSRRHGVASFPPNLPLRRMDETLLPCRVRPVPGLTLRTEDGAPVVLRGALMEGDEEAKGGEGNLYLTDLPGQVAKIYNAEHLTVGRRDKLDEMLRHDPQIRGLCWPTHMLYTRKGDFVGYTMPKAPDGALPFSKSVLRIGSPSVHEKLLPDWDRLDLVQAARSAASIVAQLHRRNILMGDVNAGNFMVDPKNSANVYVVDTDSFQLGGYPCPVGVEDFTHPGTARRLGVTGALKYDTFLRTPDEENYVLAIMIFKVLFLNQNPFVTKTKMTYREAMAAKKFSYALEGDDYEVPDGDNWMIWKNLPRKVSDAFTSAFTQWQCATAYEWVGLLDYYASSIRRYGFSRELAPMKYHEFRPDDPIYVDLVCPCCHKEFNIHKNRYAKLHDEFHTPIFCRNCNASLQQHGNEVLRNSLVCVKCGRKYDATFRENMYARAEPQKALCPHCRPRRTYTRGR